MSTCLCIYPHIAAIIAQHKEKAGVNLHLTKLPALKQLQAEAMQRNITVSKPMVPYWL